MGDVHASRIRPGFDHVRGNFDRHWTEFSEIWPDLDQNSQNWARIWAGFDRQRSEFVQSWPASAQTWAILANIGRVRSNPVQLRPTSAKFGQISATVHQIWIEFDHIRPNLAQTRSIEALLLANFFIFCSRIRSELGTLDIAQRVHDSSRPLWLATLLMPSRVWPRPLRFWVT